MTNVIENQNQPLASLDEWEDDLLRRYPNPEDIATSKATEAYRNYEEPARDTVKEFYKLNHIKIVDFIKKVAVIGCLFSCMSLSLLQAKTRITLSRVFPECTR